MSDIVVLRIPGDTARFEAYAAANGELMARVAAEGRAAGATHHLFAIGDGEIMIVDEWDSAENFHTFFNSQTEIPNIMRDGGATGAPQVAVYRRLDTSDAF